MVGSIPVVASMSARCAKQTRSGDPPRRTQQLLAFAVLSMNLLSVSACGTSATSAQSALPEMPGTVELNQAPLNDVLVGGGGTGTVFFHGALYHFAIGGLGVDGSAVAIVQTSGEVYRLTDIAQFPGIYRRAPASSIVPGQPVDGLWLQNGRAAIMHLRVPPGGRMPDIGTDAVRVVLDQ